MSHPNHGLALYVRRFSRRRHGTPKQFAKRCKDHGMKWMAIGGLWQEKRQGKVSSRMINGVDTIHAYGDALADVGIFPWVWGYPWLGHEERFVESMQQAAKWGYVLLDPELGANPSRARKGPRKKAADQGADRLVSLLAEVDSIDRVGLSTFGNGWRIKWFPLAAYTKALIKHFPMQTFIGGQTYTDDGVIDRSIADMLKVIDKYGTPNIDAEVVPNFGMYTWKRPNGSRGKRTRDAKAVRKTVDELRSHLYEFIDDGEPVEGAIGWAENFADRRLWAELHRFAEMMDRGACILPAR